MVKPIRTFHVVPTLPKSLKSLRDLAYNLRWAWDHETVELFRRLDSELWEATGQNPILLLGMIEQSRLEEAENDEGFLAHLKRVSKDLDDYMGSRSTWFHRNHSGSDRLLVAYFSAEFGLTGCLSIFAGGLGILAGDHLKSTSDLGIPLVGVGLLYQQGYFRQYLNEGGWQQEGYEDNDFYNLPLILERQKDGKALTIGVEYPDREVRAQIWRAQVGRVPLYLLDANIDSNRSEDRDITDQLYGGDMEMRIKQELLLGLGGHRALEALGLEPTVYHLNEGHSTFLALEHVRRLMEKHGLTFAEAREAASAELVFTTHTAVSAGIDMFPPALLEKYLEDSRVALGLSTRELLSLGRENPSDERQHFSMAVLALQMCSFRNAVSRLHGRVSRGMWQAVWPGVPEEEIPITHITNGVHYQSWISKEMKDLYIRYLGPSWCDEPANREVWTRADRIPAEELWRAHERRRERLVVFVRRRLRTQLERRGESPWVVETVDEMLSPTALTIGFGRRFATYKRGTLLFRDPERLARILGDPHRPVQILVAGNAHPRDDEGKQLIREIVGLARQEKFRRHLVFIEDYDMAVARYLVQGADVWLNTPRRPFEACGTSGMKAAANGVLNISTLDGWWEEAWQSFMSTSEPIGWSVGRGETYSDASYQDQVESEALYEILEKEVIPAFYDRKNNGPPRRWISSMKRTIESLCHFFNSHRMAQEYTEDLYLPVDSRFRSLSIGGMGRAKSLAAWKKRVRENWQQLRIEAVAAEPELGTPPAVGDPIHARARVQLGSLVPEDVSVELYLGRVDADSEIVNGRATPMEYVGADKEGNHLFESRKVHCHGSGLHGYAIRLLPCHPDLATPFLPGLIVWAAGRTTSVKPSL